MKNLLLLLPAALLLVSSCKKDDAPPTPSASERLTAVSWKESTQSLTLNGVEGTRSVAPTSANTYRFGADGRLTSTSASGTTSNVGTWALANNDTQLIITPAGSTQPGEPLQIFTLTASNLSYGSSYNQAQIQQALGGGSGTSGMITLLLLSAGNLTFPAGTPNINAAQLTSLQSKSNLVAQ